MINFWENAKKMMMSNCWGNLEKMYVRRKVYKQLKYSKKSKLPKDWRFLNHNVLVCIDGKQKLFKNFRKRTRKRLICKETIKTFRWLLKEELVEIMMEHLAFGGTKEV